MSGRSALVSVVIANGASLSGAMDLGDNATFAGVYMPAAWTAAALSFAVSPTLAGTFVPLYKEDGTEYSVSADVSRWVKIPIVDFLGIRYLKVRSGLVGAAVNQGASRTLVIAAAS